MIDNINTFLYAPIFKAYIDPGTGSMLFTLLIGGISVAIYGLKGLLIKLRSFNNKNKKVDKKTISYAIYTDSKRYWNIFKPICDEFEKRGVSLTYLTQSEDDPALTQNYKFITAEYIGEGNKGFTRMNFLNADIVLSSTPSLDVYQWKRSKNVKYYVHIWHVVRDATVYRMFGIDYFDSILLSGQYQVDQIRKLEELRNLPRKECKVVGCIYMDEMKKRLDSSKCDEHKDTTVLLAPSWGPSSIFNKYGSRIIDELLKTGYNIIVRPHPQSYISDKKVLKEIMNNYPNSDQLEWNKDNDNFEVLKRSDILISDFSGVIYDFALVYDKPIIYADTSFDKSIYDACWLDEEMWTFTTLPEIGKQLNSENIINVKDVIDDCLNNSKYQKGRDKAREYAWQNFGNATKDTVDYLIAKHKELEEKQ